MSASPPQRIASEVVVRCGEITSGPMREGAILQEDDLRWRGNNVILVGQGKKLLNCLLCLIWKTTAWKGLVSLENGQFWLVWGPRTLPRKQKMQASLKQNQKWLEMHFQFWKIGLLSVKWQMESPMAYFKGEVIFFVLEKEEEGWRPEKESPYMRSAYPASPVSCFRPGMVVWRETSLFFVSAKQTNCDLYLAGKALWFKREDSPCLRTYSVQRHDMKGKGDEEGKEK